MRAEAEKVNKPPTIDARYSVLYRVYLRWCNRLCCNNVTSFRARSTGVILFRGYCDDKRVTDVNVYCCLGTLWKIYFGVSTLFETMFFYYSN